MFVTGSRALAVFHDVKEKDWDIVSTNTSKIDNVDYCPEEILENTMRICETYNSGIKIETPAGLCNVVSPTGLMLLKRSHIHRPIKFKKNIRDYHFLLSNYSDTRDEEYYALLKERIKLTRKIYKDRTPSLKKTKKDFFDDFVTKKYDHDDIHYATCYYDKPIFERIKPDKDLVYCSKDLFNELSHEDKIKCVREEAFVIAIERYLLVRKKYPQKFAFAEAIERICTTLTSGWFRDFAIENWPEISNCDYDFVERFKNAGFRIS